MAIIKALSSVKKSTKSDVRNPQIVRRTSTNRFTDTQSVRARTRLGKTKKDTSRDDNQILSTDPKQVFTQERQVSRQKSIRHRSQNIIKKIAVARANWWIIAFASFCSFWIFVLGTMGIALTISGHSEILWGWATVDSFLPASGLGWGLYYLTMPFSILGYLGISGWFVFVEKKSPLRSVSTFFVTAVCFAGDMALIAQLFPWMLCWLFFMWSDKS